MGIKTFVLVLALVLCVVTHVRSERLTMKSTKTESEIEKQLKLLNKPSVKTLEYFGDLYDCVEFLKQPAFDNPLLKNHSYYYEVGKESFLINNNAYKSDAAIGLPDGGCPTGTVPIQRITKESMNYINKYHSLENGGKTYRAVVRTRANPTKGYFGSRAAMSIHGPKVSPTQYSSGLMTIGTSVESVEVGWMVNPIGYKNDMRTRLYLYTTTKSSSSCYNTMCGKFVQTNPKIPLGAILTPVGTKPGEFPMNYFYVYQERTSGVWWFAFGITDEKLGFWPREVFEGFNTEATFVEWGGEARTSPGESGPEMGTGYLPTKNVKTDSFISISTYNEARKEEIPVDVFPHNDDQSIYSSGDYGKMGNSPQTVLYGGPGPKA